MNEENELSKPVKASIIRRLVRKFTEPKLTREEKLDILRRLFRKYSTSTLSKLETINIIKRVIGILSPHDTVEGSKELKGEDKK